MKRILVCGLAAMLASLQCDACALCGCSSSNNYLGVLPDFYTNFIGLQYQYRSFTSFRPANFDYRGESSSVSHESYNTALLWGRFYISKNVHLFVFVPVVSNSKLEDGIHANTQGIGDASALADVTLLNRTIKGGWQHTLQAGGGIKAPTGKYQSSQDVVLSDQVVPNMQPGTGSWDFVFNANYTVRKGDYGINLDAGYNANTPNAQQYKYGNHFNTGLNGVYWLQRNKWTVMPEIGLRYENTAMDYDNYSKGWIDNYTGGYFLYTTAGAYVYYKRIGLHAMYTVPISQHYATGLVTAHNQFETGLYVLLNRQNKK